jgi:hypothetical protein
VFADADALDRHMELAPKFHEAVQLLSSTDIELHGRVIGRSFNASIKGELLAGFTR